MGIVKDVLYKFSSGKFLNLYKTQSVFPYYHIVKNTPVAHIEHLYPYKNVPQFKSDIDLLVKYYKPLDLNVLIKGERPKNVFQLSFDDGLEEIYSEIFPVLQAYNLKAIFFINPDFVDNKTSLYKHDISILINHIKQNSISDDDFKKMSELLSISYHSKDDLISKIKNIPYAQRHLTKALMNFLAIDSDKYLHEQKPYVSKGQIQEMFDAGHYFGAHTMSHPPLNQLTHEQQKAEIINSIEWIKTQFGISYSLFAFPFSDKGISKKMINELFEYDPNLLIFGNSGLKSDIDHRIIQRFSLENPHKITPKVLVTENLYKLFNKLIGKYKIQRT